MGHLPPPLTRRALLRLGAVGGLSLPALFRAASAGAEARDGFGRAKRCLVLFLTGGPPQHDTFDPKPDAPAEVRGEFKPIRSSVPGITVGELLPQTSRLMHHFAQVRSVRARDRRNSGQVRGGMGCLRREECGGSA